MMHGTNPQYNDISIIKYINKLECYYNLRTHKQKKNQFYWENK